MVAIGGCTALQTLKLTSNNLGQGFESLASLEGLSGCTVLQTLTLVGLNSLASLEGLSGCTALQTLTLEGLFSFNTNGAAVFSITSMPDLSSLTGLKVEGLPAKLKRPWEDGGRKRFSL